MAEDEGQGAALVELEQSLELLARRRRALDDRWRRIATGVGAILGAALGLGVVSAGFAPLLAIVAAIPPAAIWGAGAARWANRRDASLLAETELLARKQAALRRLRATPASPSIVRDLRRLLAESR